VEETANEELRNLYASPAITQESKSRRMRWKGHVVRKGKMKSVWFENVKGRGRLEELDIDVKIILEWILGK
jgi:hypothetical protein